MAVAGDVVCIEPGTYSLASTIFLSHSGNSGAWITYTSYGAGVVDIVWTGAASTNGQAMFHMYGATFPTGQSYIQFNGLTLNGQNIAADGFFCQNAHHMKYTNNTIENMGAAGIASYDCDYQIADHNMVYHNGYNVGWSSGISFAYTGTFDSYDGFHNIISNNIVSGSYDGSTHHTDGNGIILDDGGDPTPANTPASLIVNNVVFGNGGRCIQTFVMSSTWIVNNTCYSNDLDLTLGATGGIVANDSNNEHFINNIVYSWDSHNSFQDVGTGSALTYSNNLIYGGANSGTPSSGFTAADPQFVSPPSYNATAGGQYANTISPASLGNGLDIQSSSPAISAGIDPISLTGSNSDLKSDLSAYIYTDIKGNSRPAGGPFTLGAYQQ